MRKDREHEDMSVNMTSLVLNSDGDDPEILTWVKERKFVQKGMADGQR